MSTESQPTMTLEGLQDTTTTEDLPEATLEDLKVNISSIIDGYLTEDNPDLRSSPTVSESGEDLKNAIEMIEVASSGFGVTPRASRLPRQAQKFLFLANLSSSGRTGHERAKLLQQLTSSEETSPLDALINVALFLQGSPLEFNEQVFDIGNSKKLRARLEQELKQELQPINQLRRDIAMFFPIDTNGKTPSQIVAEVEKQQQSINSAVSQTLESEPARGWLEDQITGSGQTQAPVIVLQPGGRFEMGRPRMRYNARD